MRSVRPLHEGWCLSAASGGGTLPDAVAGRRVTASVPGCVHTDLLAAGLIPDPYVDDNEFAVSWVGRTDWRYDSTFDWEPSGAERHELVFDGLDTVATVAVNRAEVGCSANMHRTYRYDVTGLLRPGANELAVTFQSAWTYAEEAQRRHGGLPNAYPTPFNFIRKMACSFGWDWGLATVTAGIWRPVSLHSWSTARIDRVRPAITVDGQTGHVRVEVDLVRGDDVDRPLVLTADVRGHGVAAATSIAVPPGRTAAALELAVRGVRRWWPHSLGDPVLYELRIGLRDVGGGDGGRALDTWSRRIGFRAIRLVTETDAAGSTFTLVVNNRPVFARGVNWIPDDAFPTRIDGARYYERLAQAREANVDLVRVWGGGIYENEDFYDVCDELGLLVWQDFLFACAAYPEEPPYDGEVEAEAREAVTRLMPHPSLALWNGNNENIWGWFDWGWRDSVGERSWGRGFYLDLLSRVVAQTDPTHPYWPGSPYSGSFDLPPNDPNHGTMHIWDVWNERDYTAYRDYVPRFVAEFGYQAPPTWATLTRAVRDDPLTPDSPGMLHHQKAIDGNGKLARGLAAHFPSPHGMDDWHFLTQVNQARALSLGVEHFRSLRPRCMGTVWWQLNDCWPVTSWAVVDGDGRRKPSWYALRRGYAPRLITVQPRAGRGLAAVLVNDTDAPWRATIDARRLSISGDLLANQIRDVECPPFDTIEVILSAAVVRPREPAREVLVLDAYWQTGGPRALWWFVEDRDLNLAPPLYDAKVDRRAGGYDVAVTARGLLRDLCLFVDRLDPAAEVDDMLVTLLPGDAVTLRVRSEVDLDEVALARPPVLRCVNDVIARVGDLGGHATARRPQQG